jgi:hypothetical protein
MLKNHISGSLFEIYRIRDKNLKILIDKKHLIPVAFFTELIII